VDRFQCTRRTPLVLAGGTTTAGYRTVTLCAARSGLRETRLVHRLVLEAFVGQCPEGMESRHAPDHDKKNNALENLSYCTPKENSADILSMNRLGRRAKLTEQQVKEIRESGESTLELSRRYGCTQRNIYHIRHSQSWGHLKEGANG